MVRINCLLFFLLLPCILSAQNVMDKGVRFSGVVINGQTNLPIPNVNCRRGGVVTTTDALGRFLMNTEKGDTIHFSHVGFKTYQVVVPDTLAGEYMLAIFLNSDTVHLGEVLVMRRYGEQSRQYRQNAQGNMGGVLYDAYKPQSNLTTEQNQKRIADEFAASTNKGHVNVGFGVGTDSYRAYKRMQLTKKYKNQPTLLYYDEIDLLRRIYAAERKAQGGE